MTSILIYKIERSNPNQSTPKSSTISILIPLTSPKVWAKFPSIDSPEIKASLVQQLEIQGATAVLLLDEKHKEEEWDYWKALADLHTRPGLWIGRPQPNPALPTVNWLFLMNQTSLYFLCFYKNLCWLCFHSPEIFFCQPVDPLAYCKSFRLICYKKLIVHWTSSITQTWTVEERGKFPHEILRGQTSVWGGGGPQRRKGQEILEHTCQSGEESPSLFYEKTFQAETQVGFQSASLALAWVWPYCHSQVFPQPQFPKQEKFLLWLGASGPLPAWRWTRAWAWWHSNSRLKNLWKNKKDYEQHQERITLPQDFLAFGKVGSSFSVFHICLLNYASFTTSELCSQNNFNISEVKTQRENSKAGMRIL